MFKRLLDKVKIKKTRMKPIQCKGEHMDNVIERLSNALQYYSRLDIIHNKEGANSFHRFLQQYDTLIDDFALLTTLDKETLYKVQQSLFESGFQRCNVKKCVFTINHSNQNQTDNQLDPMLKFYKQTMDSLHFYLCHLFDCGLRVIEQDDVDVFENEIEQHKEQYFDTVFARITRQISERRHITDAFARFRTNDKYNIVVNKFDSDKDTYSKNASNEKNTTFMDDLCTYLSSNHIVDITTSTFLNIIQSEEFDSETIIDDVIDIKDATNHCNVSMLLNDEHCFDIIRKFVKDAQKSALSFSIGYRFYYWKHYKTMKELPRCEQSSGNINDHSNYDICELYIDKKYGTFKEEIFNYKHISFEQYLEIIVTKANIYLSSVKVKQTKATGQHLQLHYGINAGDSLDFKNLIALILYTDFSGLCSDFSSTFRKISAYETLAFVKRRNREYYWMSRTLRETVEMFGEMHNKPLYTGISVVMPLPDFRIRLCAPTSTSVQVEIAINFSGSDGMILKLQKFAWNNYLTTFDCSWIAKYKEEDERLLCGGQWTINIGSVRISNTKENFGALIAPLVYLDSILTGCTSGSVRKIKISSKKIDMVSHLISWKLGKHKQRNYPQYIYDSFECFCKHKKQITLCLCHLDLMNMDVVGLVMYDIERSSKNRLGSDTTNIFRKEMLNAFENVEKIRIMCHNGAGTRCKYSLSLLGLLEIIKSSKIEEIIIELAALKIKTNIYEVAFDVRVDVVREIYRQNHYEINNGENDLYRLITINKLH